MTDITKHEQIAAMRGTMVQAAHNARVATIADLVRKRDHTEKMLAEAKERAQKLPEVIAQYSADVARLEAMTAADILRELLPAPEPEQPSVAEHVAPKMYALYRPDKKEFWANRGGYTAIAAEVQHYDYWAAEDACKRSDKSEAWELDSLQIVDGKLVTKPGAKPAMLPGQVRS